MPVAAPIRLDVENRRYRWESLAAAIDLVSFPVQRDSLERLRRDFVEREPAARLEVVRQ